MHSAAVAGVSALEEDYHALIFNNRQAEGGGHVIHMGSTKILLQYPSPWHVTSVHCIILHYTLVDFILLHYILVDFIIFHYTSGWSGRRHGGNRVIR